MRNLNLISIVRNRRKIRQEERHMEFWGNILGAYHTQMSPNRGYLILYSPLYIGGGFFIWVGCSALHGGTSWMGSFIISHPWFAFLIGGILLLPALYMTIAELLYRN